MFNKPGVKNGLLTGVTILIFSHVCYMFNRSMIITGLAYVTYLIPIFFMFRAAKEEKKLNEGLLSFGEALKVTFLTFVIGFFFYALYTYIMFNVVDPSLMDLTKEISINQAEMVGEYFGIEDQLENLPEEIDKQDLKMNFNMVLMNYLVALIFPGFIYALIVSSITKKESNA